MIISFFFFNDTATTEIYTLSLHDALPVPRPRAHARGGAGDPSAHRRLPAVRRGIRLRKAVPRFPAGPLSGPGCTPRSEAPDPGRAARRVKWLTPGGLVAACAVGAGVTRGLGLPGLALLTAFFLTGSVLTQLAERRGQSRNARQGLANGGGAPPPPPPRPRGGGGAGPPGRRARPAGPPAG